MTYGRLFLFGLLNTLLVSAMGVVAASDSLGFVVAAIARLSATGSCQVKASGVY